MRSFSTSILNRCVRTRTCVGPLMFSKRGSDQEGIGSCCSLFTVGFASPPFKSIRYMQRMRVRPRCATQTQRQRVVCERKQTWGKNDWVMMYESGDGTGGGGAKLWERSDAKVVSYKF